MGVEVSYEIDIEIVHLVTTLRVGTHDTRSPAAVRSASHVCDLHLEVVEYHREVSWVPARGIQPEPGSSQHAGERTSVSTSNLRTGLPRYESGTAARMIR